jgi:hypothetical protein
VTDLPKAEGQPMALFGWEATFASTQQWRALRFHSPGKKSTLWLIPQAQTLSFNLVVSWGRSAACSLLIVTSSFARGQLEPRFCRHRAIRRKDRPSFDAIRPKFLHDLAHLTDNFSGRVLSWVPSVGSDRHIGLRSRDGVVCLLFLWLAQPCAVLAL